MIRFLLCIAATFAAIVPTAYAVQLNEDGVGQALLYPYYSVQSVDGNPLNTLISIVNHRQDAKAIRIRLREGRGGKSIARFNLYLGPNDAWAAALVPSSTGVMQLLTADTSCSRPQVNVTPAPTFTTSGYSGPNADSFGTDVERGREGWIEVIEMATLQGGSATGVTHNGQQLPNDCSVVDNPAIAVGPPSGGISGTVTVINVANGMDFGVNAVALADLSSTQFYRPNTDDYPDLNAAEITPVSIVVADGVAYRSTWTRPVDAVSAVLMRSSWMTEFTTDTATRSATDVVTVFPTLPYYMANGSASPPFSSTCAELNDAYAGQPVSMATYTREELGGGSVGFPEPPPAVANYRCGAAATVMDAVSSGTPYTPTTAVFGSFNRGLPGGRFGASGGSSGWVTLSPFNVPGPPPQMTSQPSSSRMTLATGAVTNGAHVFTGLPVIGFSARTFQNGLLQCGSISCQGNYGAAFPLKYLRKITPVN